MKRNLFAIFLAVALIIAMVFAVAPAAEAEESTVIQAQEDGPITVEDGKILDLNGKSVSVEVSGGKTLYVIDTANRNKDGETGAGKLTYTGDGHIAVVSQDPATKMRYYAIKIADAYSFHPFNLTISQIGLNTKKEAICLRAAFMANNKVIAKIDDYGFTIDGIDHTAKEKYPFAGNFINAYADMVGSLESDAAMDVRKIAKVYITIGGEKVYSAYEAKLTPREVLKSVNKAGITPTETQKAAIEKLAESAHLADFFTSVTGKACAHYAKTSATCLTPETCRNCDGILSEVAKHMDGDDANTECDWCMRELSDYVELDATELVGSAQKPNTNYISYGNIYERDNVYGASFPSDWSAEVLAKTTVTKKYYADSPFDSWAKVRSNYNTKGYQYLSVDFALSKDAKITVAAAIPSADASKVVTSGPIFTTGQKMSWGSNCQGDAQKALFTVYSNGREVTAEDKIKAGQWYTVVIKLLTDVDGYIDGESSYSSVAFSGGNGEEVYFSTVRYYTNDSYKTDFVIDYDEKDATELISYTSKVVNDAYSNQGTILGRDNVHGVVLSGWTVEVAAKTTAATTLYQGAPFSSWKDVRANYKAQGYQYIAVDFALSAGAQVRAIGCVPPATGGTSGSVIATGLNLVAGQKPSWASNCTGDDQRACFTLYSNGKEVSLDEKINANQWYTVVIKLMVNGNEYKDGESSWASVAFNAGNGNMVYFSNVRYYRNDTYKTDFVQAN